MVAGGVSRAAWATPALNAAVEHSADATTARMVLDRLVEADPQMRGLLLEDDLARKGILALACASRSLSSAAIAAPSLLVCLRDRAALAREVARKKADNDVMREAIYRLQYDPTAVEEIARRELGLIKPGEKVFIVRDVPPPASHH